MTNPSGEPTSWLLTPRDLWNPAGDGTPVADRVEVSAARGLRLQTLAGGPGSAGAADGSWGGRIPPARLAVDGDERIFLLVPASDGRRPSIRRLDPESGEFLPLVHDDEEGRRSPLVRPKALAALGWSILVADPGRGELLELDASLGMVIRTLTPPARQLPWRPVHLSVTGRTAYALDGRSGRVFEYRTGRLGLRLLGRARSKAARAVAWRSLAADRLGRVAVRGFRVADGSEVIVRLSADGRSADVTNLDDTPDLFPGAPIRLHTSRHGREWFAVPSVHFGGDPTGPSRYFDARGEAFAPSPEDLEEGPSLKATGTWVSPRLDSLLPGCAWDRVDLQILELPRGTSVAVSTYTSDNEFESDAPVSARALWDEAETLASYDDPEGDEKTAAATAATDLFIQSRAGRYLWLRLDFRGDGLATPAVGSVRVAYPRDSLSDRLPAVFSEDEESRRFLEQFLGALQGLWRPVERQVEDMAGLFDPDSAPATTPDPSPGAPTPLSFLAGWVALPRSGFESEPERLRRFLRESIRVGAGKGTPGAIRGLVRAWVAAAGGPEIEVQQALGYPRVIEGFRLRNVLDAVPETDSELLSPSPKWGPALTERSVLGESARLGESRLVSPGSPATDRHNRFAGAVRVVVPAGWARGSDMRSRLEGLLEQEIPAHVAWELSLVAPGMRLGSQVSLGVDTVLGGPSRTRVGAQAENTGARLGVTTYVQPDPRSIGLPLTEGGKTLDGDTPLP